MDPVDLNPLVETLSDNIGDLEEALEPLLNNTPNQLAARLPLLDKAKLFVNTAYAIESLLFSSLLLSGVDAKSHPIFTEITRLKQYHVKIKEAEKGPEKNPARLDKGAAARFIKHGLAGNDRYDLERAQRIAKEKAKVSLETLKGKHIKFTDDGAKAVIVDETVGQNKEEEAQKKKSKGKGKKRKVEDVVEEEEQAVGDTSAMEVDESSPNPVLDTDAEAADKELPIRAPPKKKHRVSAADLIDSVTEPVSSPSKDKKKSKREKRAEKKRLAETTAAAAAGEEEPESANQDDQKDEDQEDGEFTTVTGKEQRKRKKKPRSAIVAAATSSKKRAEAEAMGEELVKPEITAENLQEGQQQQRQPSDRLNAFLQRASEKEKEKLKKNKKGKSSAKS